MGDNSKIQWTEATWNFIVGCNRVSGECENCYAIREAARMAGNPNAKIKAVYDGLTTTRNERLDWTGAVRFVEERLDIPLCWQRPRRIFVASLSDPFHHMVRVGDLARAWAVMYLAGWHVYQVLTKRADRMRAILNDPAFELLVRDAATAMLADGYALRAHPAPWHWPLKNVWLGVSVGDQAAADKRVSDLLLTPAAVRFLSCEPLLEPVDLCNITLSDGGRLDALRGIDTAFQCHYAAALDWVIVGGESGSHARPMHPDWARSLRDQCTEARVPYFFKQWGEVIPRDQWRPDTLAHPAGELAWQAAIEAFGGTPAPRVYYDSQRWGYRIGKKAAGRLLDGREWNEYPGQEG